MVIKNCVKEASSMDIYKINIYKINLHKINIYKINEKLPAAATVEACLVVPLYLYAVLTLIYILQFINVRCDMDEAVYKTLKYQTGIIPLSKTVSSGSIYGSLLHNLGYDYASSHHIVGGNAGIIVAADMPNDKSTLNVDITYHIKNPFDIFGIGILKQTHKYTIETWLGEDKSGIWKDDAESEMVYITENSDVFHRKRQCSSLSVTIMEISIDKVSTARNENGGKYHECSSCKKRGFKDIVYITPYGDEYHACDNCFALKRTVLQVPIDSVKDRRPCILCGE